MAAGARGPVIDCGGRCVARLEGQVAAAEQTQVESPDDRNRPGHLGCARLTDHNRVRGRGGDGVQLRGRQPQRVRIVRGARANLDVIGRRSRAQTHIGGIRGDGPAGKRHIVRFHGDHAVVRLNRAAVVYEHLTRLGHRNVNRLAGGCCRRNGLGRDVPFCGRKIDITVCRSDRCERERSGAIATLSRSHRNVARSLRIDLGNGHITVVRIQ